MTEKATASKTSEPTKNTPPSLATKVENVAPPIRSPFNQITNLQQTLGNQAVQQLFKAGKLQAALKIGQPNDVYEQEADRVADQVMRMPDAAIQIQNNSSSIQRTCAPCSQEYAAAAQEQRVVNPANLCPKCAAEGEKPKIQLKPEPSTDTGSLVPDNFVSSLGAGQPLDRTTRDYFEPRFGADFSNVRVHANQMAAESANSINALAYTLGNNVAFGTGQYQPQTIQGKRLLAHELTHVVQQSGKLSPFLQRACGPAAIGTPGGCTAAPSTFVPGSIFRFNIDCDDFASGQESALLSHVRSQPASATFKIHGYASDDGPQFRIFNQNLACSRALKAQSVLISGGGIITSRITNIVNHGPTSGPASDRRSVVIETTMPAIPTPPTPAPPVPTPAFVCGPNVTTEVINAINKTKSSFGGWSSTDKANACGDLISVFTGAYAWDINELHNNAWILSYRPACASAGATPACGSSVRINNDCHYAGSVNYVIFGVMFDLCRRHFSAIGSTRASDYTVSEMLDWINKYKGTGFTGLSTPSANFRESQRWSLAGFYGWPATSDPPADRSNCAPVCPTAYSGPPFSVHWVPMGWF